MIRELWRWLMSPPGDTVDTLLRLWMISALVGEVAIVIFICFILMQ